MLYFCTVLFRAGRSVDAAQVAFEGVSQTKCAAFEKRFTLVEGRVGPAEEASARTAADLAAHKDEVTEIGQRLAEPCLEQDHRLRMLEEKERANAKTHASLSLENGNLQRRLEALEERLARPTSLPAFSSAPAPHIQATTSISASASSSTTPIVSVPFVVQETSAETVHVNTVPNVTTALQPLLTTPELRRLMPQPKFSGDRLKWKDFEAEWQLL